MSENKHTPEPWAYGEDNDGWYVEKDGIQIAHGLTEEDARRLVVCVNACAGMTNEQIDNVCMISGSLLNRFGEQMAYLGQVEKQRDELLAALEKCRKELSAWMRDHGDDIATQEAVADARAAIASVKGKK